MGVKRRRLSLEERPQTMECGSKLQRILCGREKHDRRTDEIT
jgi:hypothetical protein